MAIYELDGQAPELPADGNYFIADTATVIGKERLKNSASVWFGAVLRGDNEWIEIGEGSNVQDNATCHTDLGFPLTIGKGCTVGHNVILHGCTLEDGALVGMGSIVMNDARIGRNSIVGAGAVITEGRECPEASLIIGAPARLIRALDPAQVARMGSAAMFYVGNGPRYSKGLKKIGCSVPCAGGAGVPVLILAFANVRTTTPAA